MRPLVTHQAGASHLECSKKNYAEAGVEGELVTFIDNMAARYAECDLVICRAGALTIGRGGRRRRGKYSGAVSIRGRRSPDIQCEISE